MAAIILAVFTIVVNLRPSGFYVVREIKMSAQPAEIFAQINDFRNWQAWSPWASLDPATSTTFEGPSAGAGAVFKWSGGPERDGSMMITLSAPNEFIHMRVDYIEPFEEYRDAWLAIKPEGDHTNVAWGVTGRRNFLYKAGSVFVDMDGEIGEQFERGLAKMKGIVEAPSVQAGGEAIRASGAD